MNLALSALFVSPSSLHPGGCEPWEELHQLRAAPEAKDGLKIYFWILHLLFDCEI